MDENQTNIDKLRQRLAATTAAKEAAINSVSDADREEIAVRRQLEEEQAEVERIEREKAKLDLDRRYDEAVAADPKAKITTLLVENDDTYVLKHSQQAFRRWQRDSEKAFSNKRIDKDEIQKAFAMATVIDWNGLDLSNQLASDHGLAAHLEANTGIVTAIVNAAAKLAGVFAEARKS